MVSVPQKRDVVYRRLKLKVILLSGYHFQRRIQRYGSIIKRYLKFEINLLAMNINSKNLFTKYDPRNHLRILKLGEIERIVK